MQGLPIRSENTFILLSDLIHQRTGHFFGDGQRDLLLDKITPLVVERGLYSFLDYYYLLKYSDEAEEEWRKVQIALAVNETYFWREFDQIKATAEILVPKLQSERPDRPVRIWHAACASGEEPYSMAMALTEAGVYRSGEVEIIATDFSEQALASARQGIYRPRSFRSIPNDIFLRYFTPAGADRYQIQEEIRNRVSFQLLNLMDQSCMAAMHGFDIIFCRNTFIYFSTSAIKQVAEQFYQSLVCPGYLFVAAVESLLKVTTLFDLSEIGGAYVYTK